MNEQTTYNFSFRCYFPSDEDPCYTTHYQRLPLSDVPRWLEAYRFTHPDCVAISCKVWWNSNEKGV